MKVFCKEFITVWTRGLVSWLSRKFDSISIDLTPVEEKLDDVKSDVADVKTAVENIDFTELAKDSTVAKQGTNPNATNTAILAAFGNIDFSALAKQGDNPAATNSAILEALSHISPEDPYSQALAAFFNITPPVPNAVPMTQQEVEDDLDELWNLIITQ